MKRALIVLTVVLSAALLMGAQLTLSTTTKIFTRVASTYADSRVDTLTYTVEGNERLMTFYMNPKDSVAVTDVIVRRQFNGVNRAVMAGDTIISTTTSTVNTGTVATGAVPWTVPCEKLVFIVTYAASGNGVTTPTSNYGLVRIR